MAYGAIRSGKRLVELTWDDGWKNVRVALDGALLAGPLDEKAVRQGHDVALDDGTRLNVQLAPYWGILHLNVRQDGHFLGATSGQAERYVRLAAGALLVVSLLSWRSLSLYATTPRSFLVAAGLALALAGAGVFTFLGSVPAAWGGGIAVAVLYGLYALFTASFPGIFWSALLLVSLRGLPASLEYAGLRFAKKRLAEAEKAPAPTGSASTADEANPYRPPRA